VTLSEDSEVSESKSLDSWYGDLKRGLISSLAMIYFYFQEVQLKNLPQFEFLP
jgi:hypothetical protein